MDLLTPTVRVYDALKSRLDALDAKTFPTPKRSYVTVGEIDFPTRCAQFAVSARRVYQGRPGAEQPGPIAPHGGYVERSLEIGVAYTNCWPLPQTNTLLDPVKENEAGRAMLVEAGFVMTAVLDAYYAGELVDNCNEASLGPFVFVGPTGGVAGVTVVIGVQIQ